MATGHENDLDFLDTMTRCLGSLGFLVHRNSVVWFAWKLFVLPSHI